MFLHLHLRIFFPLYVRCRFDILVYVFISFYFYFIFSSSVFHFSEFIYVFLHFLRFLDIFLFFFKKINNFFPFIFRIRFPPLCLLAIRSKCISIRLFVLFVYAAFRRHHKFRVCFITNWNLYDSFRYFDFGQERKKKKAPTKWRKIWFWSTYIHTTRILYVFWIISQ